MPVIRELTIDYIYQDQWGVRGRNVLIMLAIYFGGIGGGLFLVATFAGYPLGALLGILIAGVGKGVSHIFFLGRPSRFWRAVLRPESSWISRGFIFFGLFLLSGLGSVLPSISPFQSLPWTTRDWFGGFLFGLSIVTAFLTITYTGFLLGRSGIPFWNNSLLPAIFGAVSLYSGAGLSGFFLRIFPDAKANTYFIDQFALWSGVVVLALLLSYFVGSYSFNLASKKAVRSLALNRGAAWWFYGLFLIVGLLIPFATYVVNGLVGVSPGLLMIVELLEVLIGALLFRYVFFRGGVFLPVC